MHRHLAGHDGGFLKNAIAVRIILGNAVGLRQRFKAHRIRRNLIQQLGLQCVALGLQRDDLFLDRRVLLLAHGERAHHVAKRRTDGAHQRRRAAAARNGRAAGQHFYKFSAGIKREIHMIYLLKRSLARDQNNLKYG